MMRRLPFLAGTRQGCLALNDERIHLMALHIKSGLKFVRFPRRRCERRLAVWYALLSSRVPPDRESVEARTLKRVRGIPFSGCHRLRSKSTGGCARDAR